MRGVLIYANYIQLHPHKIPCVCIRHTHTHTNARTCAHTHTHIRTHVCTHTCTHTRTKPVQAKAHLHILYETYFTGSNSSLAVDTNTGNSSSKDTTSNSGPVVNSSREEIEQEIANVESQIDSAVNSEDFELAGILCTNYNGFIYKEAHQQYQFNT